MVVTLFGMDTEVSKEHLKNAYSPIVVILLGMITDVIKCPLTLLKAKYPIATVVYPPSVEGIVIAPPTPV